jgi:hypothetical protein
MLSARKRTTAQWRDVPAAARRRLPGAHALQHVNGGSPPPLSSTTLPCDALVRFARIAPHFCRLVVPDYSVPFDAGTHVVVNTSTTAIASAADRLQQGVNLMAVMPTQTRVVPRTSKSPASGGSSPGSSAPSEPRGGQAACRVAGNA